MRIEVGRSVDLLNLAAPANLAVLVSVQCLDDKVASVPRGHGMALVWSSPRAAKPRSTWAGRRPDRQADGNLASEATVIPKGRQGAVDQADTRRRPERDYREDPGHP